MIHLSIFTPALVSERKRLLLLVIAKPGPLSPLSLVSLSCFLLENTFSR